MVYIAQFSKTQLKCHLLKFSLITKLSDVPSSELVWQSIPVFTLALVTL